MENNKDNELRTEAAQFHTDEEAKDYLIRRWAFVEDVPVEEIKKRAIILCMDK